MPNPWLILAVVLSVGAVGVQGYRMGGKAADARHTAILLREKAIAEARAADDNRREAMRIIQQAEQDAAALALEDEANAAPDADRTALPADSVQRINRR